MKASLRVAHSRNCPNRDKTSLASAPKEKSRNGCNCQPAYYTFHREPVGKDLYKPVKGERVHDRKTAEAELEQLQRRLDQGKLGHVKPKTITFPAWVDEFEAILESSVAAGDLKPRTMHGYMESLRLAKDAIGFVNLRELGEAELRRFDARSSKLSPASRARHLKHLSRCLAVGVRHKYADANPAPAFKSDLNLNKRIPKRGKAPFEDGELQRLWTALDDKDAPVYRYVAEFAVETGMRIGELAALDWPNVSLQEKTAKVEHTWNDTDGLIAPKDAEPRTIYLTPAAVSVLERWVKIVGSCDSGPVFPSPDTGRRLSIRANGRRFDKAMADAGIPKVHPQIGLKRSFHSLRYTTSNVMQRRGYHPRLIEATLGHSNLELTYGVYGGWTPDQLAAEAARVTA